MEGHLNPDETIDVSALVVNYNTTALALDMLESLHAQKAVGPDGRQLKLEFVFVDNASPILDHGIVEKIRAFGRDVLPGKVILHDQNAGYAGGMNLALEHANGACIFVLNPDLILLPDCLTRLYAALEQDASAGAVGPSGFWDQGKEVRLPPNILPTLGDLIHGSMAQVFERSNRSYVKKRTREALRVWAAEKPVKLDMLSGACLLLKREVIEEINGLFDDGFPLYYEDTDLFRRIEAAGKTLIHVPEAEIVHFYNRSGTTAQEEAMRRYWLARSYYYRKYYGWFGGFCNAMSRRFLESKYAGKARRKIDVRAIDLGDVYEPPVLDLGRHRERFLLEMCQDAAFLLAAGIFGEGSSWSPGESFWNAFGQSEYFLRAVDLSQDEPEEIAIFRFRRVAAPLPEVAAT